MSFSFNEFFSPYTKEEFFDKYYEKEPLYIKYNENKQKTRLFGVEELEEYLFQARPWQESEPWKNSGMLYGKPGQPPSIPNIKSAEEGIRLLHEGFSLILPRIQYRHIHVAKLCNALTEEFNFRIDANAYCTPPGQQGFHRHFDMHDVIVVQTSGMKDWTISPIPDFEIPPVDDEYEPLLKLEDVDDESSMKVRLSEGDILYIPRGYAHYATAVDQVSTHITFACYPVTNYQIMRAMIIDAAIKDPELRRTVPSSVINDPESDSSKELINSMWERVKKHSSPESAERFVWDRSTTILPGNRLESILKIDDVSEQSKIRLAFENSIYVNTSGPNVWISITGRRISIPSKMLSYIKYINGKSEFLISDLPDSLPGNSKVIFGKWLIKQGLATFSNKNS